MKKKRSEKIFCLDDKVVLIDSDGVVIPFSISEIDLKEEIDRLLEEKNTERPINIFRKALEFITGREVFYGSEKFETPKKKVGLQDSSFYQNYAQYMIQKKFESKIKELEMRRRDGKKKRKAELEYKVYCYQRGKR